MAKVRIHELENGTVKFYCKIRKQPGFQRRWPCNLSAVPSDKIIRAMPSGWPPLSSNPEDKAVYSGAVGKRGTLRCRGGRSSTACEKNIRRSPICSKSFLLLRKASHFSVIAAFAALVVTRCSFPASRGKILPTRDWAANRGWRGAAHAFCYVGYFFPPPCLNFNFYSLQKLLSDTISLHLRIAHRFLSPFTAPAKT